MIQRSALGMNDRNRAATGGLLRASLLRVVVRLVINLGKTIVRNAEHLGASTLAQAAGNAAVAIDFNFHLKQLLSYQKYARKEDVL